MASGGEKRNGPAKAPGAIDLDAPYPKSNPTVVPLPPDPEFADEISEDLLEDNADSLKLIHPLKPKPTPEAGISLEEIGVEVQTKHTTQKIYIDNLPPAEADDEATVVDLVNNDVLDADTQDPAAVEAQKRAAEERARKRREISDRTPTLSDLPRITEDDDTNDI